MAEPTGNLLLADMKRCIVSTFKDALTNLELELSGAKGLESVEASYEEAASDLKGLLKELTSRLKGIDELDLDDIKSEASELKELSENIGVALGKYTSKFCRLVYLYSK